MVLDEMQSRRWIAIENELKLVANKDPHFDAKIEFRLDDPAIKTWMLETLAPSLLEGASGVETCIASMAGEQDIVLKALKMRLLTEWWGRFGDSPADEVTASLKAEGVGHESLQTAMVAAHFPEDATTDVIDLLRQTYAREHGVDPEDIVIQLPQEAVTLH